jgi:hypothetical protein
MRSLLKNWPFSWLLNMHPAATCSGHIPAIDALFTAASAVCVTGLTVLDTGGYFRVFGQFIILFIAIKSLVPENFILVPPPMFVVKDSDVLIMLGKTENIKKMKALS